MMTAPHSLGLFDRAMPDGQINEQVLLSTVTVKEQVTALPEALLVSQLTVVAPSGKLEPDGGVQVAVPEAQLSFVVGSLYFTMASPIPGEFSVTVMFDGQVRPGDS